MEMCGSVDGTGGVWAAQKVHDGEIYAGANIFRIRTLDPEDPDLFFSPRILKNYAAQQMNISGGLPDFTRLYLDQEFLHPYHALGRIWRIYNLTAPSSNLPLNVEDQYTSLYPFSLRPDHLLNRTEMRNLFRDHYVGTPWDMTKGTAAGPFGNPYRNPGQVEDGVVNQSNDLPGAWPYMLSELSCGYSYLAEARKDLPDLIGGVCWFGFGPPAETCYIPLPAGILQVPQGFDNTSRTVFDRSIPWWAFTFVTSWSRLEYRDMIPLIRFEQNRIEENEVLYLKIHDEEAVRLFNTEGPDTCRAYLTRVTYEQASSVVSDWWNLSDKLIVRHALGTIYDPVNHTDSSVGYPDWWYRLSGYENGPVRYTSP